MTCGRRFFPGKLPDLLIAAAVIALGGCGGGGSGGSGAGTGGASVGSGGASGSGGAPSTGGVSGSGGAGTGGAIGGSGGASGSGGAPTDAAVDTGGGGSDGGGAKNCAGNAISLSANGTNRDSDAAQSRVVIDLMADLPSGNAKRTIEFWAYIKPTDWVGENNQLIMYGTGNNGTFGLDFGTNPVMGMAGNHATLDPFNNGALSVDSTAYLGISSANAQWVHIALSWDGTAMRTFVNGTARITSPNGTMATVATPLSVGCNTGNMLCFNGLFDDLRVWNVARTEAEIMANHTKLLSGNEPGLVGYWKFDEAPGAASAADSVSAAGHTAHAGNLMATNPAQRPTFVTPNPPAPIVCP